MAALPAAGPRPEASGGRQPGDRRRAATELPEQIAAEQAGIETVVIDPTDPALISTAATDVLTRFPELNVIVTMAGSMEPEG